MNKVDKILSEKEIVREQFWALPVLQQKIHIINDVNDYHETKNIIGNKADKIRFHSYMEAFDKMMYNCQYTILLEDDSMVFLFYEFNDNNNVTGHILSYLPSFRNDSENGKEYTDENNEEEINFIQLHRRISNFVRVDFEEVGRKEYYHSLIHMHIGTERNALRIPIEHFVMPFEFLFFVLKYVYHLPDEELTGIECEISRNSMLTEKEKKKPEFSEEELRALQQYLDELPETETPSEEETAELYRKAAEGDSLAKSMLVQLWLPKVIETAKEMHTRDFFLMDLVQEGNVGLLVALESVVKAETAEQAIDAAVRETISDFMEEHRVQKHKDNTVVNKVNRLKDAIEELSDGDDMDFSVAELSAYLDMSVEEIEDILRIAGEEP